MNFPKLMRPKRAGPYVVDWGVELEAQTKAWEKENGSSATTAPTKRSAAGNSELPERSNKRVKALDGEDRMSDEAMKQAFDKNEVGKVSPRFAPFQQFLLVRAKVLIRCC